MGLREDTEPGGTLAEEAAQIQAQARRSRPRQGGEDTGQGYDGKQDWVTENPDSQWEP